MDKKKLFLKILAYFVGMSLFITLAPIQIGLHKGHIGCDGICNFCHIFWHILQIVFQFSAGSLLIFYAKND